MKKSELISIIKEELAKLLSENSKTTSEAQESYVITNGKEWYAGARNHIVFAKHNSQTNLYPTYDSAQNVLANEIPNDIAKAKRLKVQRYN